MKSLTEKTDELLEQLMYCDFRTEIGIDKAKTLIRKALRPADKEARKRIAELESSLEMHIAKATN